MSEDRLHWREDKDPEIEGDIWVASNQENDDCGYLHYERTGQWMHWCWYQFEDIRMSPGCLEEVRMMQKKLHKQGNKNG